MYIIRIGVNNLVKLFVNFIYFSSKKVAHYWGKVCLQDKWPVKVKHLIIRYFTVQKMCELDAELEWRPCLSALKSRSDWNSSTMVVSMDSWYRTEHRARGNASPQCRQRMPQTMAIQSCHHLPSDRLSSPCCSAHPSEGFRMMTALVMFVSLIPIWSNPSPDFSSGVETTWTHNCGG